MRVIARESEEFIKGSYGQERFKSTTMVNARSKSLVSWEPNKLNLNKGSTGLTTVRSRKIMV